MKKLQKTDGKAKVAKAIAAPENNLYYVVNFNLNHGEPAMHGFPFHMGIPIKQASVIDARIKAFQLASELITQYNNGILYVYKSEIDISTLIEPNMGNISLDVSIECINEKESEHLIVSTGGFLNGQSECLTSQEAELGWYQECGYDTMGKTINVSSNGTNYEILSNKQN